jgi:mannose-6-phosphate isomerase
MTETSNSRLIPFTLNKQFREYVWGGSKLRSGRVPTAEVWAIYETNTAADGAHAGRSLAELAEEFGTDLLGSNVTARIGNRFPVLVKLLDCNQWLSLQVHPNDRQAEQLAGKGQFGKTEAWYFLDAEEKSEILCGTLPGLNKADVEKAVREGTILDKTNRVQVSTGDYVLIPAGTIHALGPGLLVYEVQESSDITYRVFDWNRPASQGRALHIEPSIAVIDPDIRVQVHSSDKSACEEPLVSCEYFHLEKISPGNESFHTELDGESFHAVTVIAGKTRVSGETWAYDLAQYESLIIPACCGKYTIEKLEGCEILRVTA